MSTNVKSLVVQMSERFGVEPSKFYDTLKATAFKQRDGSAPSDDQMMTLMIVAEQYRLNPFTREIYAFPDKQNGIIPVVGVDGWSRIINEHPAFDGIEFEYSDKMLTMPGAKVSCPEWVECVIYRNDRSRPIRIKEFLDEVYRAPFSGNKNGRQYTVEGPWQSHTKRQLRHKALIQCSRVAFGFGGIFDQDEAERIRDVQGEVIDNVTPSIPVSQTMQVKPQQEEAAASHVSAPLSLERQEEINLCVDKVLKRSRPQHAWKAGMNLLEQRYSNKSEREFAVQQFSMKKEAYLLGIFNPDGAATTEKPEPTSQKSEQSDQMVEGQVEMSGQNKAIASTEDLDLPENEGQNGFF